MATNESTYRRHADGAREVRRAGSVFRNIAENTPITGE